MKTLLSHIITIDRICEYTALFSGSLNEYKQFLNIERNSYDLHNRNELINNLDAIKNIADFVRYYVRTLTLEEIFIISKYVITKKNDALMLYIWSVITKSSCHYKIDTTVTTINDALIMHDDLKYLLNKP